MIYLNKIIHMLKSFFYLIPVICLITINNVFAQPFSKAKDNGLVTYKLGTDTTYIQHFRYEGGKYSTSILSFIGQIVRYDGEGILDKDGDLKELKTKTYLINNTNQWQLASKSNLIFDGDSSIYTVTVDGKLKQRRTYKGKGIVLNGIDVTGFYMFPYMGFFAPQKAGDSKKHCQLSYGGCRDFQVSYFSKNQLLVGSSLMGKIKINIDRHFKMVSADAVGSSLNFTADVNRNKTDFKNYLDDVALRRNITKDFVPKTLRDTASITIDGKKIEVDYWQPHTRGRQIFGTVVPYNRIWRTGANNATQFRTEIPLTINGNQLPPGKYSIWTLPAETGWSLIFNKNAFVWGTDYDAAADLFKVPLNVEKVSPKVEVLKISLLNENTNIRWQLEWDDLKIWLNMEKM
jgi:Protein of unknown function (DUF2911)